MIAVLHLDRQELRLFPEVVDLDCRFARVGKGRLAVDLASGCLRIVDFSELGLYNFELEAPLITVEHHTVALSIRLVFESLWLGFAASSPPMASMQSAKPHQSARRLLKVDRRCMYRVVCHCGTCVVPNR